MSVSKETESQRQIIKSSSIIGGASIINIIIGLFKIKVLAILLGPAGIGLIGLLQNLMNMASNVAAMGVGTAGTRQIAEAKAAENQQIITDARRALFWSTLFLALLGGGLVWLLREPLATYFLSDAEKNVWVGWLALGVALTVASGSQGALLNGMRYIVDLAKLRIYSAFFATILGIAAVWLLGSDGLLFFVISVPLATFILGHYYVRKLPKVIVDPTPLTSLKAQWKNLFQLGFAFMLAGLAVTLGQLAVRTLIQNQLGASDLGLFQAAWTISMTYVGFVLAAMSADYYPRLTGVITDNEATNQLVNEQTEIALLLAGPVFLAMLTLAPWVLILLYSSDFVPAAQILRWQILGDVLKVISWPIGFIIVAKGASKTFLLFESVVMLIFYTLTWFGLDYFGVESTGISFFLMYLIYLPMVYLWAKHKVDFRWTSKNIKSGLILFFASVSISIASTLNEYYSFFLGSVLTICLSISNFKRLMLIGSDNISVISKLRRFINK